MNIKRRVFLGLALTTALTMPTLAVSTRAMAADDDPIKIGVLATFAGAFTALGEDCIRGPIIADE